MRRTRTYSVLTAIIAVAVLAGCGSSGSSGGSGAVSVPKVAAARVFTLAGFQPSGPVTPGRPTTVSFTVQLPNGKPLTQYKTGGGPHTGVHLIIVRDDLAYIIHEHPPIGPDGLLTQTVRFPAPGHYRVLVDVYPNIPGGQPNFQLFRNLVVTGAYKPKPLPPFTADQTIDGYHIDMQGHPIAARDPGPVRQRRPSGRAGPQRHLRAVVRSARPRDLLPRGLARLLPHARVRGGRAELHDGARRRRRSAGTRPPRASSPSACCSPSPGRGGCSCR